MCITEEVRFAVDSPGGRGFETAAPFIGKAMPPDAGPEPR
jgi:hypothetical protein